MTKELTAAEFAAETAPGKSVYVYDGYVRLCHWVYVLCIIALVTTGFLIASPLPSVDGEASDHYVMGYIRFTHFAAGQTLGVAFLLRVLAAVIGNHQSREVFTLPLLSRQWWSDLWRQIRYYLFIDREGIKSLGHNPLAQIAMFAFSSILVVFMLLTGFAMFGEIRGLGSVADRLFGWVIPLLGGSQAVHSWHHLCMWAIIAFVCVHLYMITREEIMSKQSIFSTMISGWRSFHS